MEIIKDGVTLFSVSFKFNYFLVKKNDQIFCQFFYFFHSLKKEKINNKELDLNLSFRFIYFIFRSF